ICKFVPLLTTLSLASSIFITKPRQYPQTKSTAIFARQTFESQSPSWLRSARNLRVRQECGPGLKIAREVFSPPARLHPASVQPDLRTPSCDICSRVRLYPQRPKEERRQERQALARYG